MTFLLYLGKVMVCSGILLGYYWLFLRNKRFHHYNRFYLQVTLLVSIVLPFFRIPVLNQSQNVVNQAVYQTIEVLTVNYGEDDGAAAGPGRLAKLFTLENALYLLYTIGIAVLLWSLIRSLLYIRGISKKYPYERVSGLKFFTTTEPGTPFSFFRSIFWNKDLPFNSHDGQQIFRHELFHVQQKHSTDIIITELVTAFFWFNPFFHILKKELKAIHEFLADQYAISNNDRYAYAELLVVQTLKARQTTITNYFFQNHIKRRIAMITNNHSTRYSYGSRLMALPVLALLFCTVALYAQRSSNSVRTIYYTGADKEPITVVIDAGHGGIDPGAASVDGKFVEKDLALQISQKIQQLSPQYNVKVVMTRTGDHLPGNHTVIHEALKARATIAEQAKADMFVAIHISAAGNGRENYPGHTGFEVFVSKNDNNNAQQSKQLGTALLQELNKIYTTNTTLRQRNDKGIYVLDKTPCPAVLIECGYITNEKDLAFITQSSNQEAIAKKILEGIVSARNIPVNAESAPVTEPVSMTEPVKKPTSVTIIRTPAGPALVTQTTNTTDQAFEARKPTLQVPVIDPEDPVIKKLVTHYCRHLRYPKTVLTHNAGGEVYFSISVDADGAISNIQLYNQAPTAAKEIKPIVVIGYGAAATTTTAKPSKEEITKALQEEVKRTSEIKAILSGHTPGSTPYFFQVKFKADTKPTVTT